MISFPFESKNTGSTSAPVWDRAITAEMERDFNKSCWSNGVFAVPTNGLMVEAQGGMNVQVNPGACHIEGARAVEKNIRTIPIPKANTTMPTIHRVVIRFDTSESNRNIEIYLKEGIAATNPNPPELIQQPNLFELALADVRVPSNATSITNTDITDQRLNEEVCGMVVPAIPYQAETAELWKQIKESIDLVNKAVEETIAGDLQKQINDNKTKITKLETDTTISQETIDLFKSLGFDPNGGGTE